MKALTDLIFTSDFFYSILRVTTPLLFASMGAVVSDVAGVPNIALEGMMLMAAFAGMFFSYLFGSAWAGLAFAILTADRKSTRLNSSHITRSRMPSSA